MEHYVIEVRPDVQGALLTVVVITLVVGELARRRRPKRGATTLAGLMFSAALWNGALAVSSLSVNYQVSRLATNVIYVGVVATVLCFVLFAVEFSGNEGWITPRTLALLAVEPVLVVLLATTNGYHHLFWASIDASKVLYDGTAFTPAVGFWIHAAYSYLALLAGTVLILWKLYRSQSLYRKQAAAILVALGASWVGNALWMLEITDIGHTAGFAVTGVALFLGMFRFGLADVTPVARATVMDELDAGVMVLDGDDRLVDVNEKACGLLGLDRDDVITEHLSTVLSDYPGVVDRYLAADRISEEVELNAAEGQVTYQVRTTPVYDDRDRRLGRAVVFQDITAQKRRQRQLESQNEQLEEFASIVSHDLRNPLNVAQGYVDAVRDSGDLSMLDEIEASHDRMERLIEDMLTLARQGQRITETEPVSLADVARDAWSVVETADATLSIETDRTVPADRSRLCQVFENLFRNAIEHGGTDVTVRVGALGDEKGLIEDDYGFYVEDDGPGIPEDRREKVVEAGHTTRAGGTGFGLSIVTSIVEAHGWTLAVTESADGGARFEVTNVGATEARTDDSTLGGSGGEKRDRVGEPAATGSGGD